MKNKKLKLEDLKVQSFVTYMGEKQKQTIDGGIIHFLTHTIDLTFPNQTGGHTDMIYECDPNYGSYNDKCYCSEGGAEACEIMC